MAVRQLLSDALLWGGDHGLQPVMWRRSTPWPHTTGPRAMDPLAAPQLHRACSGLQSEPHMIQGPYHFLWYPSSEMPA